MKYAKVLALAAVVAGAFMAFIGAGTASATVLCSTTVEPCPAGQKVTTELDFSVPSGGALNLVDTSGNSLDKCTGSTVEGKITNSGSATETVTGELTTPLSTTGLTWTGCTFETKTTSASGKLEIHKIAGTSNGTVTSDSKFEVEIKNIPIIGTCTYGVEAGTSIGDLTEGNPAVFHANAVAVKFGPNALCPSTSRWTGTYNLTSPATTVSVGAS